LATSDESIIEWANDSGDLASLSFFNLVPNLPATHGGVSIEVLRNMYRDSLRSINGGIVRVEAIQVSGIPAVEIIVKIPQVPSGMIYVATVIIPFHDFSFSMKYECPEHGLTGQRDALVLAKLAADLPKDSKGMPLGWTKDPYCPAHNDAARYNLSDREQYDELIPDHPLSRARKYLRTTAEDLTINSELKDYPKFNETAKPWWKLW